MIALTITSFAYGHDEPPAATVTVDLQEILRWAPQRRDHGANGNQAGRLRFNQADAAELCAALPDLAETLMALTKRTGVETSIAIGGPVERHIRVAGMALNLALALDSDDVELIHRDLARTLAT